MTRHARRNIPAMSSERNLLGTNGQKVRLVNPRYPFFLAAILVAGGVLGAAANLWQLVAISGAAVLTADYFCAPYKELLRFSPYLLFSCRLVRMGGL